MAISVQLRTSADLDNALRIGTDGGLGNLPAPDSQYAGQLATIDNSFVNAAANLTTYHPLPTGGTTSTAISTTVLFQPFTLTRKARLTAVYANFTSNVGGTWALNGSVFASEATNGLPGAKVTDLCTWSNATVTTTNFFAATMLDTTTVFTEQVTYWLATWCPTSTSYPLLTYRTGTAALPYRQRTATTYQTGTNPVGFSVAGWGAYTAAPATAGVTATSTTAGSAPHLWLGVKNT